LLGILHRQTPQNELVDQREDGGVGADSESQLKYRHGAEQGGLTEGPESIAEILRKSGHAGYTARAEKVTKVTSLAPMRAVRRNKSNAR
jgi:hypothetical protein